MLTSLRASKLAGQSLRSTTGMLSNVATAGRFTQVRTRLEIKGAAAGLPHAMIMTSFETILLARDFFAKEDCLPAVNGEAKKCDLIRGPCIQLTPTRKVSILSSLR